MKKYLITLISLILIGNLMGCSKKDTNSKETESTSSQEVDETADSDIYQIDFQIDAELTDAFENYCLNEREEINENDIVTYGITGTDYIRRITIYSDSSAKIETYCNYRDDEDGKRICDSMVMNMNAEQTFITMSTSADETVYYSELTDQIQDTIDLISKDELNSILDQATDFAAGLRKTGDEAECFQVTYKDTNYLVYDYSYVNAEYDDIYTYSIDLGNSEGFLSIKRANENNQDTSCDFTDFSAFTYLDEKQFIENYNSFGN